MIRNGSLSKVIYRRQSSTLLTPSRAVSNCSPKFYYRWILLGLVLLILIQLDVPHRIMRLTSETTSSSGHPSSSSSNFNIDVNAVALASVFAIIEMFVQQKQHHHGTSEMSAITSYLNFFNLSTLSIKQGEQLGVAHFNETDSNFANAKPLQLLKSTTTPKANHSRKSVQFNQSLILQRHTLTYGNASVTLAWQKSTNLDVWKARMHRRSCSITKSAPNVTFGSDPFRISCCGENTVTESKVQKWILHSSNPFTMKEFEQALSGGVLTFVGDSVASQAYGAFKERCRYEGYSMRSAIKPMSMATSTVSIFRQDRYVFSMELVRADKLSNLEKMVNMSLRVASVRKPLDTQTPKTSYVKSPRQIVVVNVGLHFKDDDVADAHRFKALVSRFAKRMHTFNMMSNHYAFFRDITPQHFKSASGTGSYGRRDLNATSCGALLANTDSVGEVHGHQRGSHSGLNKIMHDEAKKHLIEVQQVHKLLLPRHDAHIENRNFATKKSLDCTHWCLQVMDVFEETMIPILRNAFL